MKLLCGRLVSFLFLFLPAAANAEHFVLVGDSTVAPNDGNDGWGDALIDFLPKGSTVTNLAVNGRSTKSYIAEGRWQQVLELDPAPDYVLIQFGHNDQKVDQPALGAYAVDNPKVNDGGDGGVAPGAGPVVATSLYRKNLRMMIRSVREIGSQSILVTPVARRDKSSWTSMQAQVDRNDEVLWSDSNGNGYSLREYAEAARQVGSKERVGVIDLNKLSLNLYARIIRDGQDLQALGPDGTHFTTAGMKPIAELVAAALPDVIAAP